MKINIKARLKNKTFVVTAGVLIFALVYRILYLFGVCPGFSEMEIEGIVNMAVNILAIVGVLVDPTTNGFSDSDRAMNYYTVNEYRKDEGV